MSLLFWRKILHQEVMQDHLLIKNILLIMDLIYFFQKIKTFYDIFLIFLVKMFIQENEIIKFLIKVNLLNILLKMISARYHLMTTMNVYLAILLIRIK